MKSITLIDDYIIKRLKSKGYKVRMGHTKNYEYFDNKETFHDFLLRCSTLSIWGGIIGSGLYCDAISFVLEDLTDRGYGSSLNHWNGLDRLIVG